MSLIQKQFNVAIPECKTANVSGLFCQIKNKFVGPVDIVVYANEGNSLIRGMKGTLAPDEALEKLCLIGACSITDYDQETQLSERKEIGVIGKDNNFIVSLIYNYTGGETSSIRIFFSDTSMF